ncbi:MAG: glycosyltransferase family 4 protein [Ignavibacteria bacterium]|nr:glycosyltransferase family 4 protein [Ignavibacteria bacterium]
MKILFDYEIFMRQKYGGISRYFYELINGITICNEFDVDVFLGYNNVSNKFKSIKNLNITENKLNYPTYLHFLMYYLNNNKFNKYLKKQSYDLFHKTYYSETGLNSKGKKVSTIHDMTHEKYPQYFTKGDSTVEYKNKSIKSSDGIVCVSDTTKNDLIDIYNIPPDKIKVIYHGISLTDKNVNSYKHNRQFILFVGQRWGYKNFNALLSVYSSDKALNTNYDLVCFGGGRFNYSERLFIKKNELQKKVYQISGSDDLLISLYKSASLFVYTSIYEGFGFPPLEAMKFGCPVLTSPAGSVKEIAGNSVIYFNPNDLNSLIKSLNDILSNTTGQNKYLESGKKRASEFTWSRSINKHYEFYKSI